MSKTKRCRIECVTGPIDCGLWTAKKDKNDGNKKDNDQKESSILTCQGSFTILHFLKKEASHFSGILDHLRQQVELQPLHVDQLFRSHAPDGMFVWLQRFFLFKSINLKINHHKSPNNRMNYGNVFLAVHRQLNWSPCHLVIH